MRNRELYLVVQFFFYVFFKKLLTIISAADIICISVADISADCTTDDDIFFRGVYVWEILL